MESIIITAPSLESKNNIGGISALTSLTLKYNNKKKYIHFITGRKDNESISLLWIVKQFTFPFKFLFLMCKNKNVDVCHINLPQDYKGIFREGLLIILSKLFNKKVVLHLRGGKFNLKNIENLIIRILFHKCLSLSDVIITLGVNEKEFIENKYKLDKNKIEVLENAVEINENLIKKSFDNVLKLLYIGRIEKNKGFDEIIQMLKNTYSLGRFKFILCGTGPYLNYVSESCKEIMGVDFEYRGIVQGRTKENIYKETHIFLLPSYFEGLPNALLESMNYGLVPICTNVGAIPNVIIDNKNGFIIPLKDSRTLGNKITELLANRNLAINISKSARETIIKNYSISAYVEKLNLIYEKTHNTQLQKIKILITSPSLNTKINVSGISSVVNSIITLNNEQNYLHYQLGRKDNQKNGLFNIISLIWQLVSFVPSLIRNKIDIIHLNIPFDNKGILRDSIIFLLSKLLRKKIILHIHGGYYMTKKVKNHIIKNIIHYLLFHSDYVIVLSEIENEHLDINFNFKKSIVLPNSIDLSIYSNSNNLNNVTFLFLGRIESNKGIHEIIDAFKKLTENYEFKFIVCGKGPLEEYFVKSLSNILKNNFEFKGVVSGKEKYDIIKESTFFLLPSYFEGLPISLLETMAAGVIPIITDVGSIKTVVNQSNGIFVNTKDSNDLYLKINMILSGSYDRNELSKNARKTIFENFDIQNYILKLNKIYSQVKVN